MKAMDAEGNPDKLGRSSLFKRLAAGMLVAGCLFAPVRTQGQQIGPRSTAIRPTAKFYGIAGTLTNSITGEAMAGATLTLHTEMPGETLQTAVTDADGRFQLNPVPAGKYALSASRRGYTTAYFDEHEEYSSAIVTGEGQDTEHIPFRLNPGAMIRGVVTDDAGEAVERARISLVRRTKNGGLGEHLVQSISGVTDDTGLFEFWNLVPGTYFLAVNAEPWFALHPSLAEQNQIASNEQRQSVAALDVAYPVTYYGGVTDEAAATPISIASGERVEANVALHAVPAIHLTMRATERNGGQQGIYGGLMLRQRILGNQESANSFPPRPGPPGSETVEFVGVAPGRYSVWQGNPARVTEIETTGSQEVDLSAGAPTFSVAINVRMADGTPPPEALSLTLQSDDSRLRPITARSLAKPDVQFDSVPPGRWNVMAQGNGLWLSVISIQSGQGSAADSRITVTDRRLSVTAVLAQGKTGLEGLATKNGKGEAGVMVVLVPRNPAANLAQFRRDQSDSDGSFLLRGVVPGRYTVVAIENGWDLDWARPEVIARYLQGGTPVTVAETAGASMRLTAPVVVQER